VKRVESVLFVTTSYPRFPNDFPGTFVHRFAKYLVKSGIHVTALAPAAPGYPKIDEIDQVQIRRFPYFFPPRWQRLAYGDGSGIMGNLKRSWLARIQLPFFMLSMALRILRERKRHDVIHCHWLPSAMAAIAARTVWPSRKPIIFTNWGTDTRNLPRWLVRAVASRVDGLLTVAVETERHLIDVGITRFRHTEIPCDEQRFNPDNVSADMRQELEFPHEVPLIAFVARLTEIKDPLTFIEACRRLKQKGVDFVAALAGDGELMPQCEERVFTLGLADVVRLLGMRTDTERLLRIAAVSVHISPVENIWSSTIAEAMMMNVPVILSDVGCTREVFSDGVDCLLVPPRDPESLCQAICRVIKDPSLRNRLAQGARELLRKTGKDTETIICDTRSYYDEVLAETLGGSR